MKYDLDTLRTVTLATAALGQTVFVLLFVNIPWWKTFLGRAIFSNALMLTVVMDFFIIGRVLDFSRNDAVYLTLYFFLSLGVWAQVVAFLRVMVSGNGEDHHYE